MFRKLRKLRRSRNLCTITRIHVHNCAQLRDALFGVHIVVRNRAMQWDESIFSNRVARQWRYKRGLAQVVASLLVFQRHHIFAATTKACKTVIFTMQIHVANMNGSTINALPHENI